MISFCEKWLKAWTGNKPQELLSFYHETAFYRDPVVKNGLKGHQEILPYFTKLLAKNPNWVWKQKEIIPTEKGFILKWIATIPLQAKTCEEEGLDIVEIDSDFKITRNEVYFDRAGLLS